MRSRIPALVCTLICGMILYSAPLLAQQKTAFEVGSKSQLFIDHELVYEARGVSFTQHQGKKFSQEPLFVADQPCEGWAVQLYGTVMYDADEELFKMWYDGSASDYFSREVTFYATSRDGIHWDKSHVGTIPSRNGKPHNAVADCLLASVIKDRSDPDASRRYKMVCYQYDRGYRSMVSPDGLHWREFAPETIVPISYVDDVITACWSEPHQVFITFPKNPTPVMGRLRRTLFSSTSPDFVHWSKLEPALVADRRDDLGSRVRAERVRPLLNYRDNYNVMRTEIYGTGAYAAESCLLTFPWMFTVTANVTGIGNHEGPMEVQMAVSRDLVHWERPFRTPIIEPGRISKSEAEWDSGMFSTAAYGFDYRDEVWLYYYGANFTQGAPIPAEGPSAEERKKYRSGVGLVTWKKDRFVSVDAAADEGVLTTIPVRFTGNRLEVNAHVKPGGSLTVELLDIGLRPISGYPRSKPVAGDSMKHVIEIGDQQDVSKLVGEPVVLQFRMTNAELYAFAFRK